MSVEILKVREVSELLGLGLSTVYRAVENGRLPAIRIGRAVRFRREAIEQFCASQEARVLSAQRAAE